MKRGIILGIAVTTLMVVGLGAVSESEWSKVQEFMQETRDFKEELKQFVADQKEFNQEIHKAAEGMIADQIAEQELLLELIAEYKTEQKALALHLTVQDDEKALQEITYLDKHISDIENQIYANKSSLENLKYQLGTYW
jgi:tRNA U34 5-carboxymethylaminomethyl modifying enzyme MnmG/GidA